MRKLDETRSKRGDVLFLKAPEAAAVNNDALLASVAVLFSFVL